jgi:hypothetical protein
VIKPALIPIEGLDKVTRGRDEWELIKIPQGNSAYVSKQTQYASLLTQSRQRSYWKATSPQNRARNLEANRNHNKMQAHRKAKAWILMTALSFSQAFHRAACRHAQETPIRIQEERQKLEPFDSVTQGQDRLRWRAEHNLKPRQQKPNPEKIKQRTKRPKSSSSDGVHFELFAARARDRDTRPRAQDWAATWPGKISSGTWAIGFGTWKWSPTAEKQKQKSQLGTESSGGSKKNGVGKINRASNLVLRMRLAARKITWPARGLENKLRPERRKWADPRSWVKDETGQRNL